MKNNPINLPVVLFLILAITACKQTPSTQNTERKTLSLQNINHNIRPGDDFFLYANGNWYDTATILPTESRAGARLEMDFKTKANIKSILEEAAATAAPKGSVEQKIGDFYASGMDTITIEKLGFQPVQPFLQQIEALQSTGDIMKFVAAQWKLNHPLLTGQYVGPDDKNSSKNLLVFYQAGLGLPDRDYYFMKDEGTLEVVNAYKAYATQIFRLTGDDSLTAAKHAAIVYQLENQMAASHRTNVELRDPASNYNKMAVADLDKKMPHIAWNTFFADLGIQTDSINIGQPAYYQKLDELLASTPVSVWKTYLRFHLLDDVANVLSNDFVMAHFAYYGKALSGQQQIKPRWERVYGIIDASIGEDLGQLYVRKYFSPEAKQRMKDLVDNLQQAFEARINRLDWMSDSTKTSAKEKLHAFMKKVGYPDVWRDYSPVIIDRNNWFENIENAGRNEFNYQMAKIDKPVDRNEWGMTPPTNNAYYNPTTNEIVFPAGILQFPMFDVASDDALNYGGIGMVIGHELTHGFDDQGSQYDKDGNLKNWWTKEDNEKFKAKGEQVIRLYDGFVVLDSVHINGALTQGENTADIGGIAIAYDAFKLTKQGQDTTKIDGLTPDQRFFLSFAQCWRKKVKDEALLQQVKTDPHSPGIYRVLGPLMNFTPFYTAFDVKEGDKMFVPEEQRIRIW
ncbi:MAG: M13 family metallopeptidase [Chitinophagales bacterium]|nr:M13 family metallopeptidase [Chitinophagales bacterium]